MTLHAPPSRQHAEGPHQELIATIVQAIRSRGSFSARLPALSAQDQVDVRWIAQLAGLVVRRLLRTSISIDPTDATVTIIIAPVHALAALSKSGKPGALAKSSLSVGAETGRHLGPTRPRGQG